MTLAGYEPATPASERSQTIALDRMGAGIGYSCVLVQIKHLKS